MELKEFIVSAITDISNAVKEADESIRPMGGLVNPGGHDLRTRESADPSNFVAPRTKLDFDIAVSASKTTDGSASAAAKIWVIEASLAGGGEVKNESVSRLTFSIDVVLPHDITQASRVGRVRSA